jgi:hypothetical protein
MRKDQVSNTKPDSGRQRSGGPRTEEGKVNSSANSQRHGILSEKIVVLQSENPEAYNQLRRNYFDSLAPVGFLECDLVEDIVWSKWRQMRAMRVETATIDEQMDRQAGYWQRVCPTVDSATRTCHAMKTLVESNDLPAPELVRDAFPPRVPPLAPSTPRASGKAPARRRRIRAAARSGHSRRTRKHKFAKRTAGTQPRTCTGSAVHHTERHNRPKHAANRAADTPPPLTVAA